MATKAENTFVIVTACMDALAGPLGAEFARTFSKALDRARHGNGKNVRAAFLGLKEDYQKATVAADIFDHVLDKLAAEERAKTDDPS